MSDGFDHDEFRPESETPPAARPVEELAKEAGLWPEWIEQPDERRVVQGFVHVLKVAPKHNLNCIKYKVAMIIHGWKGDELMTKEEFDKAIDEAVNQRL
jgi:hypothetical protein